MAWHAVARGSQWRSPTMHEHRTFARALEGVGADAAGRAEQRLRKRVRNTTAKRAGVVNDRKFFGLRQTCECSEC